MADIARRQKIPQKFLELILSGLKQGGFVESRRGAEGGYMLSRPPERIMVGELIRFMEGARNGRIAVKDRPDSPFQHLWVEVDDAVSAVVDHTSFADLVGKWREKRGKYVPNWDI
ncbi:MAG: Rrf2 family transcriptional regulator [Bryobacteraceae bacterium]